MDALLPAFLAALLAEFGARTQLLAMLLAVRFGRTGAVLAGVALAALANSLIAAAGGTLVADLVNFRALSLMLALALIGAGLSALFPGRRPMLDGSGRLGPFAASAFASFVLGFGDKTQFLTFAIAARADSLLLAAFGATAGIVLAAAPAVLLAGTFENALPLKPIRIGAGVLFLLAGLVAALGALRLI